MFERKIQIPNDNFFLFGPRATGKSTWLKNIFKADVYIDLLRSETYLELVQDPSLLRSRLLMVKSKNKIKVVIDEVQRIPDLLNEVHALIEDFPNKFQFSLTGSSARKLRRHESNLLAGRSLTRKLFPLTYSETKNSFNLEKALKYGMLPKIFSSKSDEDKEDLLRAYTETYLKEEIQQEALVRKLPDYIKFLKHLALSNGNVLNLSNLSREAGISRVPLENYMSIITDTLIGVQIEPIHLKAKIKEVTRPKFYFFDCGVVSSLARTLSDDLETRSGNLFETLVLSELRAYSEYSKKHFEINFWGTPSENEVDFICTKGKISIGIEVKYSKKWKSEFSKGLQVLLSQKKIKKAIVVYAGKQAELHGDIHLYPFDEFCQGLNDGEFI